MKVSLNNVDKKGVKCIQSIFLILIQGPGNGCTRLEADTS
jgi:hypothetical protein